MRVHRPLLTALCITVLAACGEDESNAGPFALRTPTAAVCEEGTNDPYSDEPEECGGVIVTDGPYFGPLGDELYEAPNDPHAGQPGLWLGASVTPNNCFGHLSGAPVADADSDWLADHCEVELARAFAPSMKFSGGERCQLGEPHWGAKVFASGVVRMAYLPAYHDDCGAGDSGTDFGGGHHGDTEFISVEVQFNSESQHWEFRRMFLSAHYGTFGDHSQWKVSGAEFRHRSLTHPTVWVARGKHANYPSHSDCNGVGAIVGLWDECHEAPYELRFPIHLDRNVGSRSVDLAGCKPTSTGWFAGSGRQECFYHERPFHGWYPGTVTTGVHPYSNYLRDFHFEARCTGDHLAFLELCSSTYELGFAPDSPPASTPAVALSGTTYARETGAAVTATIVSGTPQTGLHYSWTYKYCTTTPGDASCTMDWAPYAQGTDLRTVSRYMSARELYMIFRLELRLRPDGSLLREVTHHVAGAGEPDGGPNCGPFLDDCAR